VRCVNECRIFALGRVAFQILVMDMPMDMPSLDAKLWRKHFEAILDYAPLPDAAMSKGQAGKRRSIV
jgi:hypothetical protein